MPAKGTRKNPLTGKYEPVSPKSPSAAVTRRARPKKASVEVEYGSEYPIISVRNKSKKRYTKITNLYDYFEKDEEPDTEYNIMQVTEEIEGNVREQLNKARMSDEYLSVNYNSGTGVIVDGIPSTYKLKGFTFTLEDKVWKIEWKK